MKLLGDQVTDQPKRLCPAQKLEFVLQVNNVSVNVKLRLDGYSSATQRALVATITKSA